MPRKKVAKVQEEYTPSKYQTAIFDFVKNGQGNCVIEASAGSGKTWTAVKCIELIGKDNKILLTAFNTDIVDELKKKIKVLDNKDNIECRTMHSLGYAILMSNYPRQIDPKPNDFKYSGYIYNNVSSLSGEVYKNLAWKDKTRYVDNVRKFVDFGRYYLCENLGDLDFIEKHYKIQVYGDEKEVALKVMDWGKNNIETIDFTDMVWLPNVLDCKPYGRLYDWIICDECQDTMTAERMLLLRCTKMSTRMLFFGEKIQCQPAGTKILMSDGSEKDIKDINVGDEVVSYNIAKSTYSGYKTDIKTHKNVVSCIESHKEEKFIKVTTDNGLTSEYTPGHICLAKFNFGDSDRVWCVALMENDEGMFFIGKALIYGKKIHYGLLNNMRPEHCTRGWILEIHHDEVSAYLVQIKLSNIYGIPLTPSSLFGEETKYSELKDRLFDFYKNLDSDKINKNAMKCLEEHNRMYEYPISNAHNEIPHARTRLHTIRACNLVPGIMELSYFDLSNKSKKVNDSYRYSASLITSIDYNEGERDVYSLNVENTHTYVADGIATHNCIYSFMGSDYRSFDELRKLPNTISLPLSISYRCSESVVNHARKFSNRIEPRENAPKGSVLFNVNIDTIQDGDMVLCRNNAPLLQLYCELAKAGKPAYIRGKDVGANLIKVIEKTKEEKLHKNLNKSGVFSKLWDKLLDEIDSVMNKHKITMDMAMDDMEVTQQFDTIQALSAISEDIDTSVELIEKIKQLFSDKKMKGISLSTIHKAKGLEADNVFICCPSLLPSKNAKEKWELEQENNLEYVAYTRAKNNLYFLDETKFGDYSTSNQQKVNDLNRIKDKLERLYGSKKRCIANANNPEVAKRIIVNSQPIKNNRGKIMEFGNNKQSKPTESGFIPKKKSKKKNRKPSF